MVRHVLQSIRRSASLAPGYIKRAKELGLKSPKGLLTSFLKTQIFSLKISVHLDKKARPLNEMGIPIICNDVPDIPTPK